MKASPHVKRIQLDLEFSIPAYRLPIGSRVVPFCGSYLGSHKVIPKRNYYGAYG